MVEFDGVVMFSSGMDIKLLLHQFGFVGDQARAGRQQDAAHRSVRPASIRATSRIVIDTRGEP